MFLQRTVGMIAITLLLLTVVRHEIELRARDALEFCWTFRAGKVVAGK